MVCRTFSRSFSSFPTNNDVIKPKESMPSDIMSSENEVAILFSCLLIAASLYHIRMEKMVTGYRDVWRKFAEFLTNSQQLRTSKCEKN